MNWLKYLSDVFKLVPLIVAGVNQIHGEKDTATKTKMAQDALAFATAGAQHELTARDAEIAQAVSGAVATVIAETQKVHDATKPTP